MCDISQEVKDELRKFRFARNAESSALICEFRFGFMFIKFYYTEMFFLVKVDREKQIIVIDEYLEEITVEELQVKLNLLLFI